MKRLMVGIGFLVGAAMLLCTLSTSVLAYSFSATTAYNSGTQIWTYNYTGTVESLERVNELSLWLLCQSSANLDKVLQAGESYEVTGTPVDWTVALSNFPGGFIPAAGEPTYYSQAAWISSGLLSGPASITGFQLQSYSPPGDAYYAWRDGAGIQGHTIGPAPEPATLLLFGSGLLGLAGLGRRIRKW